MDKGKVIFIDSVHPLLRDGLENDGWSCDWLTDLSREQVEDIIGEYEGAVIRSKFVFDSALIDRSTKLKFIARSGSGLENIDVNYAKSKGIGIFNSPEGNRDAVGEQAVGMLLALFQRLIQSNSQVRLGMWDREGNRGYELKGKTVGIIGYGFMGAAFAQRLSGFGCKVIAYDKYKSGFGSDAVKEVDLSTIYRTADVISFHLPYSEETHYYFDEKFLEQCSRPVYIINTSRGKIVKTAAVSAGIKSGKLLGACLDVLEYESHDYQNDLSDAPEELQYLFASERVIFSPHVAGWTFESYEKLSQVLLDKIREVF